MSHNHELPLEILHLAMRISERTEHDVFAHYSPHVNGIRVAVHKEGWRANKPPGGHNCTVYLDQDNADEKLTMIIDPLLDILITNEVNLSEPDWW